MRKERAEGAGKSKGGCAGVEITGIENMQCGERMINPIYIHYLYIISTTT
jgi:hypothetical protein